MLPIVRPSQLTLGKPVVYHQAERPENPLALVVLEHYQAEYDSCVFLLTEYDSCVFLLSLRPGGFAREVRVENLRLLDLRTADCYACPARSHSVAEALTPGGWPACLRHVAMYRAEERATEWSPAAVAALYATLGLA